MCGICGILYLNDKKVEKSRLIKMRDSMVHRGPDSAGVYLSPDSKLGFGHRRLKIIDLTDNAYQPMMNESKTLCMICNGEIYNHEELRSILEENGHIFRSTSDNEVILHLYEEYGINFLNMLDGDFVFALWDRNKHRLYIVRDRLGVKPCFYFHKNDMFAFASEIKALMQMRSISKEVDIVALHHFLSFGSIPAPHTIYKEIKKLLPGHYIKVDKDGVEDRQFWDASVLFNEQIDDRNEGIIIEEFVSLMKLSIKKRLMSEVPLGVFLSGGIDSSVIVALMSELLNTIKTYSVVFENNYSCDESRYSRMIAQRFNTDHHEFVFKDVHFSRLPDIIRNFDEPFAIPSAVPLFYLSKYAGNGIKVALTGDGGDELFAGYERYYWDALLGKIADYQCGNISMSIAKFINLIPADLLSNRLSKVKDFIIKRLASISQRSDVRYLNLFSYFSEDMKYLLYTEEKKSFLRTIKSSDVLQKHYEEIRNRDKLTHRTYGDIMTTLPDEMLTKGDRMAMRNSIENRVPFLDKDVVEFSARLPSKYKLNGKIGKYIVKKSLENFLPKRVIYRRKKGFNVPLGCWLRSDMRWMISEYLNENLIRNANIFDFRQVDKLVHQFLKRKANYEYQLFPLIIFMMWYNESK